MVEESDTFQELLISIERSWKFPGAGQRYTYRIVEHPRGEVLFRMSIYILLVKVPLKPLQSIFTAKPIKLHLRKIVKLNLLPRQEQLV